MPAPWLAAALLSVCAGFMLPAAALPASASGARPFIAEQDVPFVVLRSAPDGGRALVRLGLYTSFGSPRTYSVVARHGDWLEVVSEALPDNEFGWLPRSAVMLRSSGWLLRVSLSERRLSVFLDGHPVRSYPVAVGASASPTPPGRFQITDKLYSAPMHDAAYTAAYGCCILVLSGRQTRPLPGWNGGDRLAIHAGGGIGEAVSLGCLHLSTSGIEYLMRRLPLGTPVLIAR